MKAIQFNAYGNSSVLELKQIDKPSFQEDEVLIKIAATTVNPFDMKVRDGKMQAMIPTRFPSVPGSDVAGVVEGVGGKVKGLHLGNEIFATTFGGTYAEYAALKEFQVGIKPRNVSMNEAASLAVPLVTAYTLLVETAQVKAGQKILVQGASGAVGSAVVQMAKSLGAYVIGTATGKGIAYLKSIGADEALDYKTQDFMILVKDVDLVADLVGGETQARSFQVLKKGGQLISIFMPPPPELAEKFGVKAQFINSGPSSLKLDYGRKLVEAGKIKPHIAKTFKLEQAAEAQDLVTKGGINGKVVLEIF
jgi:NADPH:quinone reductase-like Zn-dependent oxidoreductase